MASKMKANTACRCLITEASNAHRNQEDNKNGRSGPHIPPRGRGGSSGHLEMSHTISCIIPFLTSYDIYPGLPEFLRVGNLDFI